jgi:uncharacterized damage-inducible protein DinB
MKLTQACTEILLQLSDLVNSLSDEQFTKPSKALSQSTIGQHLRHTLEFFICFEDGFYSGVINYDKRGHDKLIETDRELAAATIERILGFLSNIDVDKPLRLEVNYDVDKDQFETLDTTSSRELVYNIEHAVHHMAIMKIGVHDIAGHLRLPANFGIAASTIRHQHKHSIASA